MKKKNQEEINREIARNVYNSKEGRALLADILNDLNFFSMENHTPGEQALNNEAKRLLYKLGIWREHNIARIVNALMDMPYLKEDKSGS